MAESLTTIKSRVGRVIMDVAGFISTGEDEEMESAIEESLERYSADVPREIVADVAGDGSAYDLTLPATYVDGASRIVSVEYPAGERYPLYVDGNEYRLYRTASTTRLRLLSSTPGTGQTTRIVFTAPHTLDELDSAVVTTIPTGHTHAFVNLVAAHCLFRMAARFLHEQESTLNADSVDRGGKAGEARRIGGALMRAYQEQVGTSGGEQPALKVIDWDQSLHHGLYGLTRSRRAV